MRRERVPRSPSAGRGQTSEAGRRSRANRAASAWRRSTSVPAHRSVSPSASHLANRSASHGPHRSASRCRRPGTGHARNRALGSSQSGGGGGRRGDPETACATEGWRVSGLSRASRPPKAPKSAGLGGLRRDDEGRAVVRRWSSGNGARSAAIGRDQASPRSAMISIRSCPAALAACSARSASCNPRVMPAASNCRLMIAPPTVTVTGSRACR